MVNWQDPALLLQDYLDLTKLLHAVGGLYIWETVFSAGFELNVLRGKQRYRWTIWIYLGTRYSCLLMFITFFILNHAGHVLCKPLVLMNSALDIISWAFASLIIVLRIIAIWDRNWLVSSISFSVWSAAFGLGIRSLWMVGAQYDPISEVCFPLHTHNLMASGISVPAADTILLLLMFVGLLRRAHGCKVGIWSVLYKQCIMWMIVAALVEIPSLVFIILNLNDAWNAMFPTAAVAILSIFAARMYRSLCEQGSLTEYSPYASHIQFTCTAVPHFSLRPDPPQLPFPNRHRSEVHGIDSSPLHFRARTASATPSERMEIEPFVFVPTAAELVQQQAPADCVTGAAASNMVPTVPAKTRSRDAHAEYRLSWHLPVDPIALSFE
ncbi:hypothetical protein V8E53_011588 [Lactarius tabidus]